MFFEVPGMNLGAPQTEIQKPKIKAKPVSIASATIENKNNSRSRSKNSGNNESKNQSSSKKNKKDEIITPKMVTKPVIIKATTKVNAKDNEDSRIGKSKLQRKMEEKLRGARFRYLNQKLYQSSSRDALNHFKENPEDFKNVIYLFNDFYLLSYLLHTFCFTFNTHVYSIMKDFDHKWCIGQ